LPVRLQSKTKAEHVAISEVEQFCTQSQWEQSAAPNFRAPCKYVAKKSMLLL